MDQYSTMKMARREWVKAIAHTKSSHWKDFLDNAEKGNQLWKAAKYASPNDNYYNIPPLSTGNSKAIENREKA